MAQWRKDTQEYRAQDTTNFEVYMRGDRYGNIIDDGPTSISSFDEAISVPITPVVQADALYGLPTRKFETFTSAGGSATTTPTLFQCSTGTSVGGYGVIRTRQVVRYKPGQGALARFTAAFTTGAAGYTQRAGFFSQEQAIQVGYDGTSFGVLIENDGKAHIQKFAITTLAAGDVTVTLNSVAYAAVTVSGTTLGDRIASLSAGLKAIGAFDTAWNVEFDTTKICFLSKSVGAKGGTYSMTSTATISVTGSTLQSGVAHTDEWIPQTSFSEDKLNGTGASQMDIDPTKLNVYQIQYRWLGAGEMRFSVEVPDGNLVIFHKKRFGNLNTDVSVDNPAMKLGYVAASLGGTGSNIVVTGASLLGGIEGLLEPTFLPSSVNNSRTSGMTSTSDHHVVLAVRNNIIHNSKINTRELILRAISTAAATAGGVPVTVTIWFNAPTADPLVWVDESTETPISYSTTETEVTTSGQVPIYSFLISNDGHDNIDLESLRMIIPPQNYIIISVNGSSTISRASAALTWVED
jgi:hypothetical protein